MSQNPCMITVEPPRWKDMGYVKGIKTIDLQSTYQHVKGRDPKLALLTPLVRK